jgi:general stress protein 26
MEDKQQDNRRKLHALIKDIKFAMLTTVDAGGELRSRPMTTLESEPGGDLWFFTRDDAPKVEETQHEQRVNLSYADPADNKYVSVSGAARLVRDRAKIRELWKPVHKAFFEGPDDPHLALLRVTPHAAEYWSSASNWLGQAIDMVKTMITGDERNMGDNQKLDM